MREGLSGTRWVYAKFIDKSGNISSAVYDTITLDITKPTGTVKINNGAASTNKRDIVLYLSAADTYSGINTTYGKMCFSNDGINYTPPETYKTTKTWQLSAGGGIKTVYMKFKDRAGNWSNPISDTIEYISPDTIPPTGTIAINNNAEFTNSLNVVLTPYAQDNPGGSGMDTMSFSNDGITYSTPQPYSSTPVSWILSGNDGEKAIYVKYTDKEGNPSVAYSDSIILDTELPIITSVTKLVLDSPSPAQYIDLETDPLISNKREIFVSIQDANKDRVEFYINGNLEFSDNSEPYSFSWDTQGTEYSSGTILELKVFDMAGNSTTKQINIIIDNRDSITKAYSFIYKQMDKYKQASSLRLVESYSPPYPPAQQYTAWIYDNALAVMTLLSRKTTEDLNRAKLLIQSLIWAQENDPVFSDGRLRDAYWANNLQNPDGASVKEPGSTLGNLSWVILTMLDYYGNSQDSDQNFLNNLIQSAQKIADFIITNYADSDHSGFRAGFYGWGEQGMYMYKSLEHNIVFYTALIRLYEITSDIAYLEAAKSAKELVEHLYNSTDNMFYSATQNDGWTPNQQHSQQALDCQTLSLLATGQYSRYPVLSWLLANCATSDSSFDGFDFNTDRDGIWFEGTAQVILAHRLVGGSLFDSFANYLISMLEYVQTEAQNADGNGIVSASHDGVTTGFPYNYYASPSLAATGWYILARLDRNPLWSHPVTKIRPIASINLDAQNAVAEESITFSGSDSYDPDGNIVSYHWDFGDNNSSNQLGPTHVYSQAGIYKIVLTVTDNNGLKGHALAALEVSEADHTPPTGSISISNGAQYTNSASITLNLTAQDNQGGSGIDKMRFSNDGVNWSSPEPYAATKQRSLTSGDDTKTVYVKFIDKKGNSSQAYSDTIILDTTPPDILILSPLNGSTVNTPNITLSGTIDGVPFTESRSLTEGTNTITKTATDAAGNTASKSITITLDTQPPQNPSVIISNNNTYTTSTSVTLTLSATGASHMKISQNSDFTVPVGGAGGGGFGLFGPAPWEPYSQTKSFTLSSGDGTKTIYAKFKDQANNETAAVSDTTILDTAPPVIVITSPQDKSVVNTATISLQGTVDGVAFTEPRSLTEGANTLTKTATDAAGNSASASIIVTLDTQPPQNTSVIINNNSTYTNSRNVTLTLSATGASHMVIADNATFTGASWQVYVTTLSLNLSLGDGTKTIYAKFKDTAGNESTMAQDSIILDTTPPNIIITSPANNSILNTPNITLQGTVDGVNFSEPRTLAEGANTVTKTATDLAGNTASASITITLDTQPPTNTSIIINNNSTYTNNRNVTLTINATGVNYMMISESTNFTGATWETYSTTKSFTLSSSDATKTIYAKFKDNAGNETNLVSDIIVLDATPPTSVIVTDDGDNTTNKTQLHATWTQSSDTTSGLKEYQYAIGTSVGATNVVDWTSAGLNREVTHTGLSLVHGPLYYISVRVLDNAGNISAVSSSDGISDGYPPDITDITLNSQQNFHQGWPVTIKATATDIDGDEIQYRYYAKGMIIQGWTSSSQIVWDPNEGNVGNNRLKVEVRAANEIGNFKETDIYIYRTPITP